MRRMCAPGTAARSGGSTFAGSMSRSAHDRIAGRSSSACIHPSSCSQRACTRVPSSARWRTPVRNGRSSSSASSAGTCPVSASTELRPVRIRSNGPARRTAADNACAVASVSACERGVGDEDAVDVDVARGPTRSLRSVSSAAGGPSVRTVTRVGGLARARRPVRLRGGSTGSSRARCRRAAGGRRSRAPSPRTRHLLHEHSDVHCVRVRARLSMIPCGYNRVLGLGWKLVLLGFLLACRFSGRSESCSPSSVPFSGSMKAPARRGPALVLNAARALRRDVGVGRTLAGRYEIGPLLGQGGMATVWARRIGRSSARLPSRSCVPISLSNPGAGALRPGPRGRPPHASKRGDGVRRRRRVRRAVPRDGAPRGPKPRRRDCIGSVGLAPSARSAARSWPLAAAHARDHPPRRETPQRPARRGWTGEARRLRHRKDGRQPRSRSNDGADCDTGIPRPNVSRANRRRVEVICTRSACSSTKHCVAPPLSVPRRSS